MNALFSIINFMFLYDQISYSFNTGNYPFNFGFFEYSFNKSYKSYCLSSGGINKSKSKNLLNE